VPPEIILVIPDSSVILHSNRFEDIISPLFANDLVEPNSKIFIKPLVSRTVKNGLSPKIIKRWLCSILKYPTIYYFAVDLYKINKYEKLRNRLLRHCKHVLMDVARYALGKSTLLSVKDEIKNDLHLLITALYYKLKKDPSLNIVILTRDYQAYDLLKRSLEQFKADEKYRNLRLAQIFLILLRDY